MAEAGEPTFDATIWVAGSRRVSCRVQIRQRGRLVPLENPRLKPGTGVRFELAGRTFRYAGAGKVESGSIRVLHWDGVPERALRALSQAGVA